MFLIPIAGGFPPFPETIFFGGGGADFPTFWCRQTLQRMYLTTPVTSASSESTFLPLDDLRTTLTDALSEIDYGHIRH